MSTIARIIFFCSGVRLAKSSAAFFVCSSIIMSLQIFL
nr:MAG TPA: hypothetical protein [Caudoviricetes sp.]